MSPLALYIHWPFCLSKCPYCDFNSHVTGGINHEQWAESYLREIAHYAALLPARQITSVFFGGGTPSLMAPATVSAILNEIAKHWTLAPDIEITLEANPTSAEAEKFASFASAGVNRLSLGVQSLRDDALKFLGRQHDTAQAKRAIEWAARTFPRHSFDLIYARHGQSLSDWEAELREALVLGSRHLSLYQLTIEPGTQFYTLAQRRVPLIAPEDDAGAMYELTGAIMREAGLPAYEISNYAAPSQESRHNLTYWHYRDYLGIGPGAHGRVLIDGTRRATENHRAPEVWLKHVAEQGNGLRVFDAIDSDIAQREALMMGLRLTAGIDRAEWREKFGVELSALIPPAKIEKLRTENFIARDETHLRATDAGLQRLNGVLNYLIG